LHGDVIEQSNMAIREAGGIKGQQGHGNG